MYAATVYTHEHRTSLLNKGAVALLFMLIAAVCVRSAVPVLSRLEMLGGSRGLALTLGADAPFTISLSTRPSRQRGASVVSITCSNVVYGLSDYRFTSFPHSWPLKQIVAREIKGENAVELSMSLLIAADGGARAKQKDNRWVILLSSAPVYDFAWSAPTGPEKNSGVPVAEPSAVGPSRPSDHIRQVTLQESAFSVLEDISILHRERVEKVTFTFNAPTEMIVKNMPDRIVTLFVNSKNGLSHATFKSEKDWLVKSIQLKEVAHGGTTWLGASVFIHSENGARPLVQTFPDRLVIYSVRETNQCLYMWSARNGTTLSYDFIVGQPYQVDYRRIEQKALTDSKADMAKTGSFSVGEPTPRASPQAQAPAAAVSPIAPQRPPAVRMVIVRDNVNLRAAPSSDQSSNVIARLPLGAVGARTGKKGRFIGLEINGSRGWVLATLAADSAAAPKAVWEKIEAQRLAKEKQEEKSREAQRLREEQAAMQKEKQQRETMKRQERRSAEKTAAASDSSRKQQAPRVASAAALRPAAEGFSAPKDSFASKKPEKPADKPITYQALGRDPFLPLLQDEEGPLLNIENIELVGILYDATDRIGLFEDIRNKRKAFALREKEPVRNGFLSRILPDKVLFSLNELGITRTYAMKLNKDRERTPFTESPAAQGAGDGGRPTVK